MSLIGQKTVYEWRIYCNDEGGWQHIWAETAPTVCPNVNTHNVNSNSVQQINVVSSNEVVVREETTPTGGHFLEYGVAFDAAPSTTTEHTETHPIALTVVRCVFPVTADQKGDSLTVVGAPHTTVGALTADADAGSTVLNVSSTVTDNIVVGHHLTLTDGANTDELGRVTAIDTVNDQVTVETATTNAFAAATPTYVQMTIMMIEHIEFGPEGFYTIADKKIGGTNIPAGTPVTLRYTNTTGATKRVLCNCELLY